MDDTLGTLHPSPRTGTVKSWRVSAGGRGVKTGMLPPLIRCGKCGSRFQRERKNERLCIACKPRHHVAARAARERTHASQVETLAATVPASIPGRNQVIVNRALCEARKASKVLELGGYVRSLVRFATDAALGELWGQLDQLRVFGMCFSHDRHCGFPWETRK